MLVKYYLRNSFLYTQQICLYSLYFVWEVYTRLHTCTFFWRECNFYLMREHPFPLILAHITKLSCWHLLSDVFQPGLFCNPSICGLLLRNVRRERGGGGSWVSWLILLGVIHVCIKHMHLFLRGVIMHTLTLYWSIFEFHRYMYFANQATLIELSTSGSAAKYINH